jgi:hypothetical protein
MTKSTPIIDAAANCIRGRSTYGKWARDCTLDALRYVCPKEPPAEWISAMRFWSFGRVPIPEMERQWRKQPLWIELWEDET